MTVINLLDARIVRDATRPTRVIADIDDAWRLIYAQGGVVMSTMCRGAAIVLDRPDLRLTSVSASFIEPVPSGEVYIDTQVVRSGRTAAQVQIELRSNPDPDSAPSTVATAIFTADDPDAIVAPGARWPSAFHTSPAPHPFVPTESSMPLNFLEHTEWFNLETSTDGELRARQWFRFQTPPLRPDGTWEPTALAVPGDALGGALDLAIPADHPYFAVSLQITIQFHHSTRGEWIGIDSVCFGTADGTASGLATLWGQEGTMLATVNQTAKIRNM